MNLKQLRFAVEVAKSGSFSRAAETCCATQPTLSNAIAQLEDELGGRLFARTTRKVELTPFGEYALPYIEAVLQHRDELLKAAQSYHNPTHKMLRIGFSPLVDMQRLDRALAPYRQAHPEVAIFFKECFIDDLASRLDKEQIDLQIVPSRPAHAGEGAFPFYQDPLYYLPAHGSDAMRGRLSFSIAELPDDPIILTGGGCGLNDALAALFSEQGAQFQPYTGQALTYQVIEDWAAIGIGAGILPRSKYSPNQRDAYPLFLANRQPARFTFDWIWKRERDLPAHIIEFLDYTRTTVPALIDGETTPLSAQG